MITIEVEGMSCGHCAAAIRKAVASVDPAARTEVDLEAGQVRVDGAATPEALRAAVREAGYQPVG